MKTVSLKPSPLARRKPIAQISKRQKTCPVCNEQFTKVRPIQPTCSEIDCAVEYVKRKKVAARVAPYRTAGGGVNKAKKVYLENSKKHVAKQAKAYCHRWIRWRDLVRDGKTVCMACQKPMSHLPNRAIHAMHFRSSGQNSAIRYHEDNLRMGCYSCNSANGGNLTEYETHLTAEIGVDRVEWLKTQNQTKTWTIEELRDVRDDFGGRLKSLNLPLPSISS